SISESDALAGASITMPATLPAIALTSGEPAGIGPDLCLALAEHDLDARIAVLADLDMLAARAARLGSRASLVRIEAIPEAPRHRRGRLAVLHVPAAVPPRPGELDVANAAYVLELLRRGCDACVAGSADALV